MPRATKTAPKRAGATWRSWFLGAIMIAGLAAIVLHFGEVRNFALLVLRAEPLWLLLAVLLQLSTYASVASGWSLVLSRAGTPRPLRKLIPIAVTKLFADQAVPAAGAAGNILLVDQLVGLGVPRGTAVGALLLSVIGYFIAFALFALAMLFVLWLHNEATALMAGVVTMFLLVALAVPSLALWLRHRGSRPLSRRIEHIGVVRKLLEVVGQAPKDLVSDRRLLVGVSACNGLVFLADAATLWACLHALGGVASYATAFIAFIMSSIAVTLAPLPMGLGSFEATSTATLRLLGTGVEAAFAATILLRLLTLWLPMIPGMLLMRRAMRGRSVQGAPADPGGDP